MKKLKNNFSAVQNSISNYEALNQAKEVLKKFGLVEMYELSPLNGAFNTNWLVSSKKKKYILKRRNIKNLKNSKKEVILQDLLKNKINTAAPVFSLDNSEVVISRRWCFTLFEYIDGRAYSESIHDFALVANALSDLHYKTSDIKDLSKTKIPDFNWTVIKWAKEFVELCRKSGLINIYHIEEALLYLNLAEKEIGRLEHIKPLRKSLVHWNFHNGNLLIKGDDVYVFDFEFAHFDNRIADIANSLPFFVSHSQAKIKYDDAATFIQPIKFDMIEFERFLSLYDCINQNYNLTAPAALQ